MKIGLQITSYNFDSSMFDGFFLDVRVSSAIHNTGSVMGIAGLIPPSLQLQAQVTCDKRRQMSQVGSLRGVSAVRALEMPVLVCLPSSCSHVTEEGKGKVHLKTGIEGPEGG